MTIKKNEPEELNYFKLSLLNYLRESFPELLNDEEFINSRSDRAAQAYEDATLQGYNSIGASELSNVVLYEGFTTPPPKTSIPIHAANATRMGTDYLILFQLFCRLLYFSFAFLIKNFASSRPAFAYVSCTR